MKNCIVKMNNNNNVDEMVGNVQLFVHSVHIDIISFDLKPFELRADDNKPMEV